MGQPTRVLITGGSGFVGANLVRSELLAGSEIHLLLRSGANLWRIADLLERVVVHRGDLTSINDVRRAVEASRPEIVYHLAAHGVYPTQKDRATILTTNLAGTANLLEAMAGREYQAFVHAGSSAEYGHKNHPIQEIDHLEPRTDYGVSKAAATLLCQAEAFRGAPITTLRIFCTYGPWEESSRLVPYVMESVARGEAPRVTSGTQPRDFIFIEDVVDLFCRAARSSAARGQILNAGSGQQRTVAEMIETILDVCGASRLRPHYGAVPTRADEPTHWVADLERTTTLTGWRPRFDVRNGVRATWQWYSTAIRRSA